MQWFATGTGGTGRGGNAAGRDDQSRRERARGTLDQQLKQIEWLASTFFGAIILSIVLYSVAEWWRLGGAAEVFVFDLGVLFALIVAASVIGGLLGFLFGIPRSLQGSNPTAANGGNPPGGSSTSQEAAKPKPAGPGGRAFASNSNLEEISDWLTKIIVGVSLIQATTIYTKLFDAANWFKGSMPKSQGADVMFILVLISALVGGFLFLYLQTRTRVMSLFADLEDAIAPDHALDEPTIRTALQAPIDSGRGQAMEPSSSEDEQLLKIPYEALQTGDQLAAWASAQARAGNLQAANQALRAAIAKEPEKKDFLVRLADVLERQGSPDAARALITEAQQKGGDDLALLKRDLLRALYLGSPESFNIALPIAQKLLARPDGARDPFVHAWTAAAEGQKYYWLSKNNGAEADKQAARARALAEAKKVVELAPDPKSSTRILLRGMLDPATQGAAAEDNDLECFKNDEEFKNVINGPN